MFHSTVNEILRKEDSQNSQFVRIEKTLENQKADDFDDLPAFLREQAW